MKDNHYQFVQNRACEYFPCHNTQHPELFNCLFCYCPLYAMKSRCGGNFRYLDNGIKDCSNCSIPHQQGGYLYIMSHMQDIMDLGREDVPTAGSDQKCTK